MIHKKINWWRKLLSDSNEVSSKRFLGIQSFYLIIAICIMAIAIIIFINTGLALGLSFITSRSGGANFIDAGEAKDYLITTLNWTVLDVP